MRELNIDVRILISFLFVFCFVLSWTAVPPCAIAKELSPVPAVTETVAPESIRT